MDRGGLSGGAPGGVESRVLVLSASAADTRATCAILQRAGVDCVGCTSMPEVCRRIAEGVGTVLLSLAALDPATVACLLEALSQQPMWSDLPVIVLLGRSADERTLALLGPVQNRLCFVEDPVRPLALLSMVQTALRARRHQYQIRDHLAERERYETTIRQGRTHLQRLLEAGEMGIWEVDLTRRMITASEGAERLFGYEPRGTRPLADALNRIHSEDRPEVERILGHPPAAHQMEFRVIFNGHERYLVAKGELLRNEQDQAVGIAGAVADITSQKRAEKAARQEAAAKDLERRRLRTVLDALPVGVFISDTRGKILEANAAAGRIWASPRLSEQSAQHGEDYKAWWVSTGKRIEPSEWPLARAVREGQVSGPEEIEIEAGDGHRKTILNYALPIRDAEGRIAGGVAVNVDISERRRSEEKLALLAAIVETSFDAIIVVNLEGIIQSWNAGAERLYGYTANEITGESIDIVVPVDRKAEEQRILERVVHGERIESMDAVRVRKNGHLVYVSMTISPLRDSRGTIIGAAGIERDVSERKRFEERLQYDAFHDKATALPNRALFLDRLALATARLKRTGHRFATLVLDLDNFKFVNETFGHLGGDRLLYEFGQRVLRCLRPFDTVARYGGDEFAVLLEEAQSGEDAEHVAGRILDALKEPFLLAKQPVFVGSSIGIAVADEHYRESDEPLRDADEALFEAKRRGKARYVVFERSLGEKGLSRTQLEAELRRAIDLGELIVHYQPIVDVASERFVGCEALVRWRHRAYGDLAPTNFISLAEETGLILPLDRLVMRTACRDLAEWRRNHLVGRDFFVSVNVSPKDLFLSNFSQEIGGLLREHELEGRNLWVEVTESVVIKQDQLASQILNDLKDLGVVICMDNFGTGYSSLSFLYRLPIDVLKVSRSFIGGLPGNAALRGIVQTLLLLAKTLNLEAVAEGTENAQQVQEVKALGFRWAQGFGNQPPVDRNTLSSLLATRH